MPDAFLLLAARITESAAGRNSRLVHNPFTSVVYP